MDAQDIERTFTYGSPSSSNGAMSPLARLKALLWMGGDGELGQIAGRFIALVIGFLYAHLAVSGAANVAQLQAQARYVAYAYFAYLVIVTILVLREGKASAAVRYANTFVDVNGVSLAIYLGGEQVAPGVFFYLWAIAGNGFRYGPRFLYFGQTFAIVGFSTVIVLSDYWFANWVGGLLILAVVLIFLPLDFAVILERIEDAKVAAESANRTKSGFLAVVSHEMRTPLNIILGIADLMRDTRLDAEQCKLMDTLSRSATDLQHLVTNVLDLAQIEAGKLRVQAEHINYSDLVAQAVDLFRFEATGKNITLSVAQDAGGAIGLRTDPRLVRQVLINLVGNAVKFTERGHSCPKQHMTLGHPKV